MAKVDKIGGARRFGMRYGRKLKERFNAIEKEQRKLHKCPFCNYIRVKRLAMGIWQCNKCNAKFAGKAYAPSLKIVTKEEIAEAPVPEEQEDVEEENYEEESDEKEPAKESEGLKLHRRIWIARTA